MPADSSMRERLENDEVLFGAAAWTLSPSIVEVYGAMGLDYAFVDLEHTGGSPYDSDYVGHLTRAADAWDLELLVRLPSNDPPMVRKVLDAGARNLVIPRVRTPEDIETAIRAARFTYEGEPGNRGVGYGRPTTWGERLDPNAYHDRADRSVGVAAMIELEEALDNLEDILAVPDLMSVSMGQFDLAASMGVGDPSHPDVVEAIETWKETSREAGVPLSLGATNLEEAREAIDEGGRLIGLGDEMTLIREAIGDRSDEIAAGIRG